MPVLSREEQRKREQEPVDIVIISSCRAKANDKADLVNYEVGQEEKMIHKYADDLLATKKAVIKGTPAHKQWIEKQKETKKAAEKKQDEIAELRKEVAELKAALKK